MMGHYFEQPFGLGRREFEQKVSKNSNAPGSYPGGCPGGCLSFDLTGALFVMYPTLIIHCCVLFRLHSLAAV